MHTHVYVFMYVCMYIPVYTCVGLFIIFCHTSILVHYSMPNPVHIYIYIYIYIYILSRKKTNFIHIRIINLIPSC